MESENISWQPWQSLLMPQSLFCWSLGQSQDNIQKALTNESPRWSTISVGSNALICNPLNTPSTLKQGLGAGAGWEQKPGAGAAKIVRLRLLMVKSRKNWTYNYFFNVLRVHFFRFKKNSKNVFLHSFSWRPTWPHPKRRLWGLICIFLWFIKPDFFVKYIFKPEWYC